MVLRTDLVIILTIFFIKRTDLFVGHDSFRDAHKEFREYNSSSLRNCRLLQVQDVFCCSVRFARELVVGGARGRSAAFSDGAVWPYCTQLRAAAALLRL